MLSAAVACRYPPRQAGESPWAGAGMDAEESDSSDGHGSSYFSGEPVGTSEAGDALSSRSPSGTLDALLPAGSAEAAAALQTQLPPWLTRHSTGTTAPLPAPALSDGLRPGGKLLRTLSDQNPPHTGVVAQANSLPPQAAAADKSATAPEPPPASPISLPASSPFAPVAQVPVQTPASPAPQDPPPLGDTPGSAARNDASATETTPSTPVADGPWTGADYHSSPSLGSAAADTPDSLLPGNLYSRGREVSIGPSLSNDVAAMMAGSAAAVANKDADKDSSDAVPEAGDEAQSNDGLAASHGLAIRIQPGAAQGRRSSLEAGMGSAPLPDSPLQSACSPASRGSSRRSASGESGGLRSRLHPRSVIGKMAGALNFGHRSPTLDPLTTSGSTDSPVAAEPRCPVLQSSRAWA